MEKPKPIKRHEALQPLSRQHHFGLLFSWKIRKGFAKEVSISRMKAYADWFFEKEIQPHFKLEEEFVFPVLGNDDPLIERALKEHREIKELFEDAEEPSKSLQILEEKLTDHIRFEERTLFNRIQEVASKSEIEKIDEIHLQISTREEYTDAFWEN
ncbi:hemerythrin domain-containing protein [Mesonia ostreae]|uniref:Hemerythrin domain-containing protein n=1 Tax=Mesonia ostreae TaxID=861110 RepID=A0ABU2KKJ9_9FLAO|nr:hemerythrin domain-containing protein [Mesonia ostreae]MDT0295197.1 hemerythrin domain-containing protein [Mesonia ostreae]